MNPLQLLEQDWSQRNAMLEQAGLTNAHVDAWAKALNSGQMSWDQVPPEIRPLLPPDTAKELGILAGARTIGGEKTWPLGWLPQAIGRELSGGVTDFMNTTPSDVFTGANDRSAAVVGDFFGPAGAASRVAKTLPIKEAAGLWNELFKDAEGAVDVPILAYGGKEVPEQLAPVVAKALDKNPDLENIIPFLNPRELVAVTPQSGKSVLRAASSQPVDELSQMALAGAPKMGWYEYSSKAIKDVFGEDAPRFAMLLAALSPQTSVESNLQNATKMWANWVKAGRPQDPRAIMTLMGRSVQSSKGEKSVLDAWKNNSIAALTVPQEQLAISGPKVDSFGRAVQGDLTQYVLDAWMANASGVGQDLFKRAERKNSPFALPGFSSGYVGAASQGRKIAEDLSAKTGMEIAPSNVQENIWSWARALYELRKKGGFTGPSARDLVEGGQLTKEMIGDVPDFSTLLAQGRYGDPLKGAGYGPQIEELAGRAGGSRVYQDLSEHVDPAGLGRAADIIDNLYKYRTYVSDTATWRHRGDGAAGAASAGYSRSAGSGRQTVHVGDNARGELMSPDPGFKEALSKHRNTAPEFYQLRTDDASRREFVDALSAAQQSRGWIGKAADVYSPNKYRGSKIFITPDKTAGFAVKPDGEVASVLSDAASPHKGFTTGALNLATQNGGTWLMGFDTVLPGLYAKAGFRPVARIPWDDAQKPEGWDYEAMKMFNNGRPDVVFMVYDPSFKGVVANGVGGEARKTFDDAYKLTQRRVKETAARIAKENAETKTGKKRAQLDVDAEED